MSQTENSHLNNYINKNTNQNGSVLRHVLVVGAGLAGVECSWYLANRGIKVFLVEGKFLSLNPAQKFQNLLAELVCSNSLKSVDNESPHGVLKREMSLFNSLIIEAAYQTRVPAGDALAVDRELFSQYITNAILSNKNITLIKEQLADPMLKMKELSCDYVVIATGPLTSSPLDIWIRNNFEGDFYFYDAIAPVVDGESLDYSKLYWKDRYKDQKDHNDQNQDKSQSEIGYLNAPFDSKDHYIKFVEALRDGEKVSSRDFEELKFFESCLPVDVMAQRGVDTLRFSCMKPVGLEYADGKRADGKRPYAVVQLRRENLLGDAYNLVGFQTRLTYREQERIFKMIPGFENAKFLKFGSIHRNSFLFAKKVLNSDLSSKKFSKLFFAGQITGVEGYTESAASGIYVGYQILHDLHGLHGNKNWPLESAMGSLINYLMTIPEGSTPSPSNINMGLFPPLEISGKIAKNVKRKLIAERAYKVMSDFCLNKL
ncbi:MAG: methylenetetrahydrofolate--tRNA-(uracil(54)-C(5))-methyltransferase (FADH(2)-oxidizing) TrmFO [Oligoflexia bacterium]|nr:methylenetetrahydrofolate--tRNA-(uracil(54)-C(5))-methyltransferase (FADH(2)-oxidizing) TrmFO [Oligoflexia bacterium]